MAKPSFIQPTKWKDSAISIDNKDNILQIIPVVLWL